MSQPSSHPKLELKHFVFVKCLAVNAFLPLHTGRMAKLQDSICTKCLRITKIMFYVL